MLQNQFMWLKQPKLPKSVGGTALHPRNLSYFDFIESPLPG